MLKAAAVLGLGLVLAAGAGAARMYDTPRGIRNNNPGNLRFSVANDWLGQVGHDAGGYVIFDTPAHGLRALAILLSNYQARHGISTLEALVNRYAPSADGNDERAYVLALSAAVGVGPEEPFNITAMLAALMAAIIRHENGRNPYSLAAINSAVRST